ncbi:Uncharacterised protein [Yersinia intermedia]|uniref:hypothetical protein n=1 Tax=Yersinia intermedia TaxID=631 RepID=UPI0005E9A0E0|nr:hypothetical protein [Yersinia intermedia]CQJ66052.1 Uncharacterised protein [Yersinia intermedia]
MNAANYAPCWEVQPFLDEESVTTLLQEIADVLGKLAFNEHELDDKWINGCRAYAWVKNHLDVNQAHIPGLVMISNRLDFVFTLNAVPLQFVTDRVDSPKKKHRLLRNEVEYEQYSLFGDSEPEQDIRWRVYAEVFFDEGNQDGNELPTWIVSLVGFNAYGAIVSKVELQSKVTSPISTAVENDLPPVKDIEEAPLKRRGQKDSDQKDNYGTV